MKLFVDMDGVLADFDAHYEASFGVSVSKLTDDVDWARVRATDGFFRDIPPMADMRKLWARIAHLNPIVLTGVPTQLAEKATENKRAWVQTHLGDHIEVRCCRSKEKCLHAEPGDILIDDWTKYQHLWVARGGVWITHTSAAATIVQLDALSVPFSFV